MALPKKGLFLDFDGTLADSLSAMRTVYDNFLISHGKQPKLEEFQELNGPPLKEVVTTLKETHSLPGSANDLYEQYLDLVKLAHSTSAPAAGALDLLMTAKEHGWTIAIVTSSNQADVWAWLKFNGLSSYITNVVGGDDVKCGKPDPEPYLLALSITNCEVDISWSVEDTSIGATSALSAGLKTFVIASEPDYTIMPTGVTIIDNLSSLMGHFEIVEN